MTLLDQSTATAMAAATINRMRDRIGWSSPRAALDDQVESLPKMEVGK